MFVHLHTRSWFSFRAGGSCPADLVQHAARLGQPALALTDRHGIYGTVRFQKACRVAGVHAVLGAEIIADVKASQTLFDEIARLGGKPVMWRTGHSVIKARMAESGAPLAGEMSGHIFFADRYYGYDDALYAAVRLLSYLARSRLSITQIRDRLPQSVNTPELRIQSDDLRKFEVVREVRDRLREAGADMNEIDGVRVRTEDGWWLLRASNTQDVLVARCEAKDEAGLDRLKAALAVELQSSNVAVPEF